jgi:hypothetical protein
MCINALAESENLHLEVVFANDPEPCREKIAVMPYDSRYKGIQKIEYFCY